MVRLLPLPEPVLQAASWAQVAGMSLGRRAVQDLLAKAAAVEAEQNPGMLVATPETGQPGLVFLAGLVVALHLRWEVPEAMVALTAALEAQVM